MSVRALDTPHGPARLEIARARSPVATLLVSHGAGAGADTHDLEALAAHLPRQGVTVARLTQPWRVAGRKVATAPATLDDALLAAVGALRRSRRPLVLGGRSAGARSAARCAVRAGAAGCLALSFPLHPPGRPGRSRLDELTGAGVPTLVVQGERDPMGTPDEFPADLEARDVHLVVVPDADHSLRTPKRSVLGPEDVAAILVEATVEWVGREVAGTP